MAEEYVDLLQGMDEVAFDEDEDFTDPDAPDAARDRELINTPLEDPGANQGESVSPEDLARYRQYEQVVNQFNSNPVEAMRQLASQVGMELRPAGSGATPAPSGPAASSATPTVEQVEDLIENENMKFLAPVIAKVAEAIAEKQVKAALEPLQSSHKEILTRNRQQEYAFAAGELAKKHPSWSAHEADMQGRLEFVKTALNGGPLMHHKYGNLLELMYNWAAGRNEARGQVAADYRNAPRTRAPSSSTSQNGQPNILQLIAREKDPNKADRLAFEHAVREVIG